MKSSQMMNGLKLTTALLSCFTMVMSPVAMGAEAERISRQQIQKNVVEFGLDRKETVGQFWDKSKMFVPANLYQDLQAYVNKNRNMAMPEVTGITASKGTDGSEVPTLQMSQGGKTYTIQMFGEKNRYMRINGVTLTESDMIRLRPALARLEASDINIKKQGDKLRQDEAARAENEKAAIEYTKDFARFKGFPRITPQMWSSMSPTERAGYIVKMRLMWGDAQRVNEAFRRPATAPAPSKKNKNYSLLEKIYEAFVGEEASAETSSERAERLRRQRVSAGSPSAAVAPVGAATTGRPDSRVVISRGAVSGVTADGTETYRVDANAPQCIVAGYVGGYGRITNRRTQVSRMGCSADAAMASYRASPQIAFAAEATARCQTSNTPRFVACNPIVYGYKADGSEICVDRDTNEFQDATHYPGPCDPNSRLGPADTAMPFSGSDYANVPREEQLRMIEAAQRSQTDPTQDYLMTKNFLASVLAHGGNQTLKDKFERGVWDIALDNELVRIQTAFETDINRAIVACEARLNARNEYDSRQRPACDQLHRRWLFTERFIEKIRVQGCPANSTYIGQYPTAGGRSESTYGTAGASGAAGTGPSAAVLAANTLNKRAIVDGDRLCQCTAPTPPAGPVSPPAPPTAPLPPAQPMPPRAPAPAGSPDLAPAPPVTPAPAAGERVAFGGQCPLPPSPPPPNPPPVPPPPAPPAATCPGSGVPISVPADGPFNFCACPRDNNVRVPIGQNVVCPPTVPPTPPPGPVPPATCSQPQGIENFDYETCRCISGSIKTKSDGRKVCEGNDNTGLIIGGVALAGLAAFLLLRKNNNDPKCPAGTTYNGTTRVCSCAAIACDLTTNDYNAASCSCTPKTVVPPVTCPNPAQTNVGGVCQCVSAGLCTGPQKIYDYQTCQCTDKPEPPKCENGTLPRDGNMANCPIKCPDNSYVTPPATCPVPTEGGNGDSCPSGDCNGGAPGTGR